MSSVRKLYEAKARPTSDPKKILEQAWLLWAEGNDEVFGDADLPANPQQFEEAVELLSSLDIGQGNQARLKGALRSPPVTCAHILNVFMRGIARRLGVKWGSNDFPPSSLYEAKPRPTPGVRVQDQRHMFVIEDLLAWVMNTDDPNEGPDREEIVKLGLQDKVDETIAAREDLHLTTEEVGLIIGLIHTAKQLGYDETMLTNRQLTELMQELEA